MIIDQDPRRSGVNQGPLPGQPYGDGYPNPGRPRSTLYRFLGGSPLTVLVKLLVLSILVGAGMALIGLTPGRLFWHAYDTARAIIDLGLDAFQDFGSWILAGAVVVIPLWLIARLLAVSK